MATTVVELQLVMFREATPRRAVIRLQVALSLVPLSTMISPPIVANELADSAVRTAALVTNGGVVSMMAANVKAFEALVDPARVADTSYVTPRSTVTLHRARVCCAKHGTHG